MKKIAALSTLALIALVAGCNSGNRVEGKGTTTDVQACEKGSACCKVTGSKDDCKSECSSAKASCEGTSGCTKSAN